MIKIKLQKTFEMHSHTYIVGHQFCSLKQIMITNFKIYIIKNYIHFNIACAKSIHSKVLCSLELQIHVYENKVIQRSSNLLQNIVVLAFLIAQLLKCCYREQTSLQVMYHVVKRNFQLKKCPTFCIHYILRLLNFQVLFFPISTQSMLFL